MMENANRKVLITIVVVLGVLIVIGAYFLFQGEPATPGQGTASTTGPILGQSITDGKGIIVSGTQGGNGEFGAVVDTSNAKVGGTLPMIKVNLTPNARGKVLVVGLVPAGQKAGVPQEILISTAIMTDGLVYNVQGLRLSEVTNATTGEKTAVTPGSYQLEFVLWDKNPFAANGTYAKVDGNNATAVLSGTFTISR